MNPDLDPYFTIAEKSYIGLFEYDGMRLIRECELPDYLAECSNGEIENLWEHNEKLRHYISPYRRVEKLKRHLDEKA